MHLIRMEEKEYNRAVKRGHLNTKLDKKPPKKLQPQQQKKTQGRDIPQATRTN